MNGMTLKQIETTKKKKKKFSRGNSNSSLQKRFFGNILRFFLDWVEAASSYKKNHSGIPLKYPKKSEMK